MEIMKRNSKYYLRLKAFTDKSDFAFCPIPTIMFIKQNGDWILFLMWLCYGIGISNYED